VAEPLTTHDFDELLTESFDTLPEWVVDALGDAVVRVEPGPMRPPRPARPGPPSRLTIYRQPALSAAASRTDLRRLVRSELVDAVVRHLELDGRRTAELAREYF
jgi:predicted Zn-dependent protease with MMP-like domain